MEANFCRCLFAELAGRVGEPRVDKIFNPAPEVWTFSLSAPGGGIFLLFRHDRKNPLIFLSKDKPDNPREPSARCMWFRKRLSGAALVRPVWSWPSRALAWQAGTGREEVHGKYLVFDLAGGLELVGEPPAGAGEEPDWPDLDRVLEDNNVWREFTQITPPLRRSLSSMPRGEAEAVYGRVVFGECREFYVYQGKGAPAALPWRLPESMRRGREELVFGSALEAAAAMGQNLFKDLKAEKEAPGREAAGREERRLVKNIENAERDLERLKDMEGDARRGEIVKSVLHEHGPDERLAEVEGWSPEGERETVRLDPEISLAANMERFFKRSGKARRGLKIVAARKKDLEKQLKTLREGGAVDLRQPARRSGPKKRSAKRGPGPALNTFVTDDGFTVLSGKNQRANHELLSETASRHDLWFHARGASGSHVILKRDHPGQEVPARSMDQAAAVAGHYSAFGSSDAAEVVCALVSDVRKVKGGAPGLVTIDKEYASLRVAPDPALVRRLKK